MNIIEIEKYLNKLALDKNKYCILGSASLVIRGIKETANDIDILLESSESNKIIKDDKLDFTIKETIDNKIEWYNNYPLQTLEEMLQNKKRRNLEKDKESITYIEKELKNRKATGEYVDLYDNSKNKLNEIVFRKKGTKAIVAKNKYIIVVIGLIKNSKGLYLIQKASKEKNNVYCFPGGHTKTHETSLESIKNELKEEMNLKVKDKEIKLIKTYKFNDSYKDIYLIEKDLDINKLIINKDEVSEVKLLNIKEIEELISKNLFREHDVNIYYDILKKRDN